MNRRRRRWLTWMLVAVAGLGAAVGLGRWRRAGGPVDGEVGNEPCVVEPEAGNEPAVMEPEAGNERAIMGPDGPAPVPSPAIRPEPPRAESRESTLTSGPLISVIVTTADVSLTDALAALEQQDYRDWELIAVVVEAGPPPVCGDGRVSIVLAPVGDRRTGERLALGRARGPIVTRGIPSDRAWLAALARRWRDDAGHVAPVGERAEDAFGALLAPQAGDPAPGSGRPAVSAARPHRPAAGPDPLSPRRPELATAGG